MTEKSSMHVLITHFKMCIILGSPILKGILNYNSFVNNAQLLLSTRVAESDPAVS